LQPCLQTLHFYRQSIFNYFAHCIFLGCT
jgi:hypothetical protein